jgi:uncharacterized protein YqeY
VAGGVSSGAMSIHDELAAELRDAMRSRDRRRMDVIRQVETELARARTEPGFHGEVDDALYRRVIASYVKKMDKARLEFEAAGERGRLQAEKLGFEIDYLKRWQAQALDEAATRALVRAAIAELGASDPRMSGRVTGQVMKAGAGSLDGSLVSRLVREELGG